MSPDVAASVRARLLNQARGSGEEFERTLAQFDRIGERIIAFLGPVWQSIISGDTLADRWPPKGSWSAPGGTHP